MTSGGIIEMDADSKPVGERKRSGFAWPDLLLVVTGALLLFSFIDGTIALLTDRPVPEYTVAGLWLAVSFNALLFIALPLAWLAWTVHGGWKGMRQYTGMAGGMQEIAIGAGLGVAMVIVFGGIALLLEGLGLTAEDAPISNLLANLTWPLAIAFSLVAGIGEEILLRGIVQRWLGWLGQGLLFGALHFPNAGWLAVIVVGTIGILFGYLRHRGISLFTLMAAHFVYNFILMSVAILFPEAAGGGTA